MAVGALATGLDFTVLSLLVHGLGFGPRAASPFALFAGVALQFVGNKLFAFEDRSRRWGRQALLFGLVEALGIVANLCLFDVAVRVLPLPLLVVRAATQATVYFGICLPLWNKVFAQHPQQGASKAVAS
ncbi:MAG: GtrA family protein [Polyangiaceae bacterium]